MSLPITPTPKLNVKDSKEFWKRVQEKLKIPAKLIPTPKLKDMEEPGKIMKYYKEEDSDHYYRLSYFQGRIENGETEIRLLEAAGDKTVSTGKIYILSKEGLKWIIGHGNT